MADADRPTWYLTRDGKVVPASSRGAPKDVTHWTREGDDRWHPIEAPAARRPAPETQGVTR